MSFLNSDKVLATQTSFSTEFNRALNELRATGRNPDVAMVAKLATPVSSTGKIEQHNWLGPLPVFKEWVAERELSSLRNNNYRIVNKKWANGVQVDVDDLEDDRLGLYMPQVTMMAEMAMVHQINLMMDFLVNGFATTKYGAGYDDVAFFSASHKEGDGTNQSNLVHHSLDDSGALDEAFQTALSMKDENGEPYYMKPTTLIVGPANRANANQAVLVERLASGASNPNYKAVDVYVSPRITDSKWFLADLSKAGKPLILQTRRDVAFRSVGWAQDDDGRFMTDQVKFGADARYNVGYGFWQLVVGSDATS